MRILYKIAIATSILIILVFIIWALLSNSKNNHDPNHRHVPTQKQIFEHCQSDNNCVYEFTTETNISDIKLAMTNAINAQGGPNTNWAQSGCYAFLFHPGIYDFGGWNIPISFQTSVRGLGEKPEDTVFKNCTIGSAKKSGHVTDIFWRDLENLIIDDDTEVQWYTSQECPIRRFSTKGDIVLDNGDWSSGGFLSNVQAKNIKASSQQQFCLKNISGNVKRSGNMNWVLINSNSDLKTMCNNDGATSVVNDKEVYDKPFILGDGSIRVPKSYTNNGYYFDYDYYDIVNVYNAKPSDTASIINDQINKGNAIIFTPGTYTIDEPIKLNHDNDLVIGLGWPVLKSGKNKQTVFDVTGSNCIIAGGMLIDGESGIPDSLVHLRSGSSSRIFDVCCRVLRPKSGNGVNGCKSMILVDQDNVYAENIWLWVADHQGSEGGVADSLNKWNQMRCKTGITVNGDNTRIFGLAVEHQYDIMTFWKGNNGECYFYQSEFAYGGDFKNSPSYIVDERVTKHILMGGGAYFVADRGFNVKPNVLTAFMCPDHKDVQLYPVLFNGPTWGAYQNYVQNSLIRGPHEIGKGMICK